MEIKDMKTPYAEPALSLVLLACDDVVRTSAGPNFADPAADNDILFEDLLH